MEGRYPKALLFALTEPNDLAKRGEFDTWYRRIHIPDVTTGGIWNHAIQFTNTSAKPGEGYSLVTYETGMEPDEANKAMRAASQTRGDDRRFAPGMKGIGAGTFKRIGGEHRARVGRPVCGVLAVVANCDPAREAEFNRWYDDVHLLDIMETGAFHTAYRYESTDVATTGGKYLAIYESEYEPAKAREIMAPRIPKLREMGRVFDGMKSVRSFSGNRVWPAE